MKYIYNTLLIVITLSYGYLNLIEGVEVNFLYKLFDILKTDLFFQITAFILIIFIITSILKKDTEKKDKFNFILISLFTFILMHELILVKVYNIKEIKINNTFVKKLEEKKIITGNNQIIILNKEEYKNAINNNIEKTHIFIATEEIYYNLTKFKNRDKLLNELLNEKIEIEFPKIKSSIYGDLKYERIIDSNNILKLRDKILFNEKVNLIMRNNNKDNLIIIFFDENKTELKKTIKNLNKDENNMILIISLDKDYNLNKIDLISPFHNKSLLSRINNALNKQKKLNIDNILLNINGFNNIRSNKINIKKEDKDENNKFILIFTLLFLISISINYIIFTKKQY
jgi:hypothetical protein